MKQDQEAIITDLIELLESAEHELDEWNSSYPGVSGNTPMLLEMIQTRLAALKGPEA